MESSLRFYVDGLGFKMKTYWIPDRSEDHPDGRIRWCRLELGEAAIGCEESENWSMSVMAIYRQLTG
jgi:lactoylglutathione lyase